MTIVRPQKPPLHPAQPAVAAAPRVVQAGTTPENMHIDVMSTAPSQPVAPTGETITVIPSDPATPQLPQQTVSGPGPDTLTPQIIDGPDGTPMVVSDPATAPITTEEVVDGGSSTTGGAGSLLAVPIVAAAIAMAKKSGAEGASARRDLANMGVGLDGEILDPEKAKVAGLLDDAGMVIDGTATDVTSGGAIENISEGADDDPSQRNNQGTDTGRSTSPEQPRIEPDTQTQPFPDTAAGPAAVDPATAPIDTADVVPPNADAPDGFTALDGPPPDLPDGHEGGVFASSDARTRTVTHYVQGSDGRWYASKPQIATPDGLKKQREMTQQAYKALRSAIR